MLKNLLQEKKMEKVIKVKNLEELKKYGIEYIPPYPKEKLNELTGDE